MIKINLNTTKKALDLTNMGGLNITKMKFKLVLIAIIFLYLPDFVVTPIWEDEYTTKQAELTARQAELSSLKRKVSQSAVLEKQIKELKAQEENLGEKLTAVKQAISLKKNPSELLLYIAKNIPADLWIQNLSIEPEQMIISGEALSWDSVGNFVNNLRSSVFIKDASIKSTTSSTRSTDKRRVEKFEIYFGIARL